MGANRPFVAGNWKMNGQTSSLVEIDEIVAGIGGLDCDTAICPPTTLIAAAVERIGPENLMIGGQDCAVDEDGAHTGDISAEMIADLGAKLVIVGHSERRADHGETDDLVRQKAEAAWRAHLLAIICIGETEAQRLAGETLSVLESQLWGSVPVGATAANCVIAYEPVWAIGTGLTPSTDDIQAAHAHIRAQLVGRFGKAAAGIRLQYGGSVKPTNARDILQLADVDGALVGGASLKAADFVPILRTVQSEQSDQ